MQQRGHKGETPSDVPPPCVAPMHALMTRAVAAMDGHHSPMASRAASGQSGKTPADVSPPRGKPMHALMAHVRQGCQEYTLGAGSDKRELSRI